VKPTRGLHHITAVASDPQTNVEFYEDVLGQRLVKTTVNFDDPATYHLCYGDEVGSPGTIITFFPWPHMRPGRNGVGETATVAYAIPETSTGYWDARLSNLGIGVEHIDSRFGHAGLRFSDPSGMSIELIVSDQSALVRHWGDGPVPLQHAIQGFHGVTLWLAAVAPTAAVLTDVLQYTLVGQEDNRHRYRASASDGAACVDLVELPEQSPGVFGAGSIHHIAFRAANDLEQADYGKAPGRFGQRTTPVKDRQYFRSIYFREPGGVLFEVATDGPGFTHDETVQELGTALRLPPWLEGDRKQIDWTARDGPSLSRNSRRDPCFPGL